MLLITFATVLISSALQNGAISEVTEESKICLELISKIGDIACSLIGEGVYYRLGESSCLISCSGGTYPIELPDRACDRILKPESWQGYVQVFHHLPPKEFEFCDETMTQRLQYWLTDWQKRNETAYATICKRKAR
ncbi:uncharacterized protein LOC120846097 [Ixodes scapularis]|uniref:uncharacterized protein LOC120846097 n=1 Tax=Ixodes scapularis TaxID=6945 RepID=UPI001A9D7D7A|nr:uncharacterized protein LOC120846097 [Ixodes scapularis]